MRILKAVFFVLMLMQAPWSIAAEKVYTFGVVPQQAASEMAETWLPFLNWLSAQSGVKLRFVTAPDIPSFEKRLAEGAYDIAYMNPYHYTVFHKKSGYEAMAKEKDRKLKGILVVRRDSPVKDIKDLNAATLVFPAPAAFAASILPRAALRKAGVSFTAKFVSSHDSVYLNVAHGLYPAGGGIVRTFDMLDESAKKDLRVLWTTPAYTPHAIASHPGLPKEVVKKLLATLSSMVDDSTGQEKLKLIGLKGIEAAHDADWDDIRQLNISELDTRTE
ncbi:MAG TPA: phosphate ABC transporter substrate-binding protein [Gallionella sp.]|jgi:phosphonate transport system substrate-binding protein|nr:phosphate/phosphite/phosphonate ABC transporter substrate-binding protein [Gallionella sp.]OGS66916.1 MAG: phosphate ABC transporter substrate-binding protein [Gallionellales bacterium GWA2_54_124]OGT20580.1 MAG: phosphate ABC transporter substrate-binding protein [Gallionellales bacterium RIFOXYD12_FULL_53_10]HCI53704.1 phosphate ABC transporter substrate-binding protein [Gallionella sp.]